MSPAAAITGSLPVGGGGGGGGLVPASTTSCGRVALASRLGQLIAVPLVVASAKLTLPLPLTSFVTSSEVVVPAATLPEEAVPAAAGGGAFCQVIVRSPHELLATP